MKLFDKFRHTGSNLVTQTGSQTAKDPKNVITSTILETGEKVEFSQENLEKASQDIGEFKKTLEGKNDEEKGSLTQDFITKHKDISLALVALAGLQFGATTAQGFNHKEVMNSIENLEAKLDSKNLKKLSDSNYSAEVKEFIAGKHDVEKEVTKLQQLSEFSRLYKPTRLKGLMKTIATTTLAALWTLGPAAATVFGCMKIEDGLARFGIIVGGAVASGITNYLGWAYKNMDGYSRNSIYHNLTKDGMEFNTKIGPAEGLERLEKHKTVKVQQNRGAEFDKIKDLSHLSITK